MRSLAALMITSALLGGGCAPMASASSTPANRPLNEQRQFWPGLSVGQLMALGRDDPFPAPG